MDIPWTSIHCDARASSAAGRQALELALASLHLPQLVVSPRVLERVSASWQRIASPAEPPAHARPSLHARPHLPAAYLAPCDAHEQQIAQTWEDGLGIGQIGIHDSFLDLGGDSLMAT